MSVIYCAVTDWAYDSDYITPDDHCFSTHGDPALCCYGGTHVYHSGACFDCGVSEEDVAAELEYD